MKRMLNQKVLKFDELEKIFKTNITNPKIYEFLEEHNISLVEAGKYFSEFKLYNNEPQKYLLKYEYGSVILEETQENSLNPGIYTIEKEYFIENKLLKDIDKTNNSKIIVIQNYLANPDAGMYLCADNGVGKTTLAVAIANAHYKSVHEKTLFVFWPDFIEKTKRFNDENVSYINKVKYAKRLIIDDLGQESITQWARDDILHPIISYRLEKGLTTYITSNYLLEELEGLYTFRKAESKKTKSIIEKIKTLCKIYVMEGVNLRAK